MNAAMGLSHAGPDSAKSARAYPERASAEPVRHRDFTCRVQRRVIDDPVAQRNELHGGFHQWAGAHAVSCIVPRKVDVVGVFGSEDSRH